MIIDKRILKCVCERETVRVLEQAREREGACENQPGIKVRLKTMGRSGVGRYNERSRDCGCAAVMEPKTPKPKFSERIRNKFGKTILCSSSFFHFGTVPPFIEFPTNIVSAQVKIFSPGLLFWWEFSKQALNWQKSGWMANCCSLTRCAQTFSSPETTGCRTHGAAN